MHIRLATKDDAEAIKHIELSAFDQSLGTSFLIEELSKNPFANYFLLESEDKVALGYMGVRIVDDHAEVMNFAILKTEQGKGHGTKLLEHVLAFVFKHGVRSMSLEVRKSNTLAQYIYEKYGFEASYMRPKYYNDEDAIVYFKEFTDDYFSH